MTDDATRSPENVDEPVYWRVESAARLPPGEDWLATGERATLAGLRFAKRRNDWLLGRWTAKRALARQLGLPDSSWPEIEIRAAADGAPEPFLAARPLARSISLSHAGGRALCAVAPGEVAIGCDLETIEPRSQRFVEDYLTAGELRMVEGAPPEQRALAATLVWSAKESALKLVRQGLRLDTRSVELTSLPGLAAGDWQAIELRRRDLAAALHGWWRPRCGQVLTVICDPPRAAPIAL